jgi:hypothetical protein
MRLLLLLLTAVGLSGCTHRQLSRSMVSQASTIMVIEYQMVLDNIAMFSTNPDVLPWHVRIADGTVQINDEGGVPEFGVQWGSTPGITRAFKATRSITEQWGADAVTDPLAIKTLQDVYRQALGLPPIPDPRFLKEIVAARSKQRGLANLRDAMPSGIEELPPISAPPNPGESSTGDQSLQLVLPDFDVPSGWFCVGCKKEVPPNACFVGHCGERYVWVLPEGVADLSHFTLIVLAITKQHAAGRAISSGLVFTR